MTIATGAEQGPKRVVGEPMVSEARTSPFAGYLRGLLAGGLAAVAGLFGFLLVLDRMGNLPPPAIANNICIDEKLAFLRDHTPQDPTLLVIGSSIAWRNFDGVAVANAAPGVRPLNGAFCSLRVNQAVFAADWLLERLPSIRTVLLIASPHDFEACTVNPTRAFDREDADRFVFGQAWRWGFYFRYFDPISLLRNMSRIAAMRANLNPFDALVFTRFGDGPLDTGEEMGSLVYGDVRKLDPACFSALRSLARRLADEGRRLIVVTTPLHPEWKRRHDADGLIRSGLASGVTASFAGTDATLWNGDATFAVEPHAFVDAIHLRWSAVRGFSEMIAQALQRPGTAGARPEN